MGAALGSALGPTAPFAAEGGGGRARSRRAAALGRRAGSGPAFGCRPSAVSAGASQPEGERGMSASATGSA